MLWESLWVISAFQGWFRTSEPQNDEASRTPFEVQFEQCFAKMNVFSKCFWALFFKPFLGDRKGRQKGFRSRGSMFFTFAPILKKTSKGHHFGTLVESICRLKSFTGRYRKSRTTTRDIDTPPPGDATFRVLPGCQATPARWNHLKRKTKGREQKTHHFGPHPGLKSSTSNFQGKNYLEAHFLKGGLYIYIYIYIFITPPPPIYPNAPQYPDSPTQILFDFWRWIFLISRKWRSWIFVDMYLIIFDIHSQYLVRFSQYLVKINQY